jgi:hypothetical protein
MVTGCRWPPHWSQEASQQDRTSALAVRASGMGSGDLEGRVQAAYSITS